MHIKKVLLKTFLSLLMFLLVGCGIQATTPAAEQFSTEIPSTLPSSTPAEAVKATAVAPTQAEPSPTPEKIPLLFDDDGSRDGMAALLYLLNSPEISIRAITVSYGEAHPEKYIQLIGRALDQLGIQNIPLGAGQDKPLAGGSPFPDWLRGLSDNFWDYPLAGSGKEYSYQNAPELMVDVINQSGPPVTVFVSGTFTNLAQAIRLDPAIVNHIEAVYFMGGAVNVPGNITNLIPESDNHVAEWNILADPQSAKEVFGSGLKLYMVPLDATNRVILTREDLAGWHLGGDIADMAADLYDIMFINYGFESAEIFDLTAAVIMANPGSCNFSPLHLEVITGNGPALGQTRVSPESEANVFACLEPDPAIILQNLSSVFAP